ncbi:MAG: hypothetical protein MJ014_00140 [Methanocorpusculum sp.]|nr:hypothetical protein [Methanocorpusculum sp.]
MVHPISSRFNKDRWPQWCDISTSSYLDTEHFAFDGTPIPELLYPFGMDDKGKPIRIPCHEAIIFQAMGNPNSLYPADHANAITREVRIYIELPKKQEILAEIYPHQSWIINVYDKKDDETGRSYLATRASIYTVVNPHIEFVCAPQE